MIQEPTFVLANTFLVWYLIHLPIPQSHQHGGGGKTLAQILSAFLRRDRCSMKRRESASVNGFLVWSIRTVSIYLAWENLKTDNVF